MTVTAVVLPVRTVVVDDDGAVEEIWSNTEDLDGTHSLYVIRSGAIDGPFVALDTSIWGNVRLALAQASAGSGRIV
jgi:hypothetical protein